MSGSPQERTPTAPTHAGGVVFRRAPGGPEYLLVRPRAPKTGWVLPKGHIELGETPRAAALREVLEEAGVRGEIRAPLAQVLFGRDRVEMFLMAFAGAGNVAAERQSQWLPLGAALEALAFDESRQLLRAADALVRSLG